MAKRIGSFAAVLLLAAFFGFVGWNKAFAPLAELARHGAWTVHLPELFGRLFGWSEMTLAAALLAAMSPRWRHIARIAAWLLIANQIAAAAVHYAHGESAAMPQNAVLIAVLFVLAGTLAPDPSRVEETA
jgi:DoxX-like family